MSKVDPDWIKKQREQGWPDMHPEDYCHRCGNVNPSWFTTRGDWLAATSKWAAETGREGICCPQCFEEMFNEATGSKISLQIIPIYLQGPRATDPDGAQP